MENVDNKNKEEVKNEIEDLISEFQEDTDTETEVLYL